MSVVSRIQHYGRVFGQWSIKAPVDLNPQEKTALFPLVRGNSDRPQSYLKVVTFIEGAGSYESLTPLQRTQYLQEKQNRRVNLEHELRLMHNPQRQTPFVHALEYTFQDWSDSQGFGCDLLLRLPLLTNLRSAMESGTFFQEKDVVQLGCSLCAALAQCHDKGLIHAEIRPEAIYLDPSGQFLLGDFSFAKALRFSPIPDASSGSQQNPYWAPEQGSGQCSIQSDLYSLGLVLYTLSNHNAPPVFAPGMTAEIALQQRMLGRPLPSPAQASAQLSRILLRACDPNSGQRYQSASQMLEDLRSLLPGQPRPAPPETAKSPGKRLRFWVAAALTGLVILTAAGLACFRLLGKDDSSPGGQEASSQSETQPPAFTDAISQTDAPPEPDTVPPAATTDPMEEAYAQVEALSSRLMDQGEYAAAAACIATGSDSYPQDPRYAQLLAECTARHKAYILDTAEALAKDRKYRAAIALLDDSWDQYGEDAYFQRAADYRMEFAQYANSIMAAGKYNSAVILDGVLHVVGDNEFKENEATEWSDVIAVSIGDRFVMALHRNGTVSITGQFAKYTAATNPGWTDVVAIAAGDIHAVALTSDGTLLAVGSANLGQENVSYLKNQAKNQKIVSIAAGYVQTLALLDDGTVIASGEMKDDACSVYHWDNVVSICAGTYFSAALLSDGTVRVTGKYTESFNASQWTDIDAIAAGDYFLVGLKSDGTVIAVALGESNQSHSNEGHLNVSGLRDILQIAAGHNHIMALDRNGILHCIGPYSKGACDMDGWKIVSEPANPEQS